MSVQDVRGRLTSPAHVGVALAAVCGLASIAAGAAGALVALVAVLVAADLGDTAAAHTLIRQWDECRRAAGLAAPAGLAGAVADRFGLDQTTPGRPAAGYAWRAGPFEDLIRAAETWCGSGISVAGSGISVPPPA